MTFNVTLIIAFFKEASIISELCLTTKISTLLKIFASYDLSKGKVCKTGFLIVKALVLGAKFKDYLLFKRQHFRVE